MAEHAARNPDGSPNRALNAYRKRAIEQRKDKGQVSVHFHLNEFRCHDGSHVPERAHDAIRRLCLAYLEPLRAQFGACVILSGYRPANYNASIGGAIHSQHVYDVTPGSVAADLRFARGSPRQWTAFAKGLRGKYRKGGGIGRYDKFGFVHVDNRTYNADWSG